MSRRRPILKGNSERQGLREPLKPTPSALSNSFNPSLSSQSKPPLPAIPSQQDAQSILPTSLMVSNDAPTTIVPSSDEADLVLPTKLFTAKKTSVNGLSQAACSYLWFRRIKEIFLVMEKQNDAFSSFDMELARTDMIQTCEQYLESERLKGGGINMVGISRTKTETYYSIFLFS
ncbi:unnamed protein product [Didymodactylos carnosus]|uniref:Uncharacterized protein n=1 Tax=Didymodactylos carnosus TaxID=1234261 RepID=A0A815QFC1_9BILA|nr:unnamed protein product [Didymodactylos carnosus]CAF4332055.1 unnamed protein product [Didymodactylos carnosus]